MSGDRRREPGPGAPDDRPAGKEGKEGKELSGPELAREALAQAKADARRRGEAPGAAGASRGGRSSRRRSTRAGADPLPLRTAIDDFLSDRGWEEQAAVGSVFGRWPELVGPGLAEHTRPDAFEEGVLIVVADSTAWATQVRLLAASLIRRLNEELGDGTVRRVTVRGPAVPGWRTGRLRTSDSRGPRDTYG